MPATLSINLKTPHEAQQRFIDSTAKRKVIRAGRRGGKTVGIAILAVQEFLKGKRVLYASPSQDQLGTFWYEVQEALREPLNAEVFYKNESLKVINVPHTKQQIKAKTAWDSDSLRGDFADLLILDEAQMMNESVWTLVGGPMLADKNGDLVLIFTPPSVTTRSTSKASDPRWVNKLFDRCATTPNWEAFHFSSYTNPHISKVAIDQLRGEMSDVAFRQEMMAEDIADVPGAVTSYNLIQRCDIPANLERIHVGVDPSGGRADVGIVVVGQIGRNIYILDDATIKGSPEQWGKAVIRAYNTSLADRIVVERNFGGDMCIATIRAIDPMPRIKEVSASRGKIIRAQPLSAAYEQGRVFHCGVFTDLEQELTSWVPESGMASPNRLDACVWACYDMLGKTGTPWIIW
jgi:hypothetical protein